MPQINVIKGDITKIKVDAIVNAANTTLMGGGGVDGAIHRVAGPALYGACEKFHGCPTGEARITGGFNLPAKFIIHTPGPIWHGGDNGEDQFQLFRNNIGEESDLSIVFTETTASYSITTETRVSSSGCSISTILIIIIVIIVIILIACIIIAIIFFNKRNKRQLPRK